MTVTFRATAKGALSGFCDCCGKPKRAQELTLVCVQERQSHEPKWVLLCGTCFVDGDD